VRALLLFLLTALGFASASFAVRGLVPWPEDQGLWGKWEYFERHKDEYDAVWLGTSLVFRGVDTPAIDATMAERGHDFKSFNFGIGGMGTFEQDFVLHKLLELEPARLKYVFLEGGPVGIGVHPRHIFQMPGDTNTMRSAYWHDSTQTGKVLVQVPRLPLPLWRKIDLGFTHVRLLGRKTSNYGFGPEVKRTFTEFKPADWLVERDGFHPYKKQHGQEIQPMLDDPAQYDALLAEIPAVNARPMTLDELDLGTHRAQNAAAERAGVRLIYLAMPGSIGDPERQFLHQEGVIPELWDYSLPTEYPELFRLEHRWDVDHLNPAGVEVLTALLAARLAATLEAAE
jgi:hypothetical protein